MSPSFRRTLVGLAWLGLCAFTFVGLNHPLGDGDECIHAGIFRNMLRSGDYLHLRWYGVVLWDRPQLPYWLAAPFASLLPGELGLRAGAGLCSLATLYCVYRAALAAWGRLSVAMLATLLLAGAPSFHGFSRALMSDSPLLLGIGLALWGTLSAQRTRAGLYLAAFGIGVAFAAKSLAAGVPALALAPWLVRAAKAHGDRRALSLACAIVLALALPFYVIGLWLGGMDFVHAHITLNLLARAKGGFVGLGGGLLAYCKWLPRADGPWVVAWLVLGSLGATWLGRRQTALAVVGSFALLVFCGMSLIGTRLPHYVLPMYPAAALGAAGVYAELTARSQRWRTPLRAALAPTIGLLVLLASLPLPGASEYLLERPYGKILGLAARDRTPASQPIYAFEWYGTSLSYYAERRIVLLTAHRERFAAANYAGGPIERAHLPWLLPPLPAADGSQILVAGHIQDLNQSAWFDVGDVVAASPPYFLVWAKLHMPRPGQLAPPPAARGH